ncbi:MAG TPA: zf-HC2 domain-containing protein [Mycobacterium sp.]|nr:zf-HC2 domain-containing protein [Mycobacterium sp.]
MTRATPPPAGDDKYRTWDAAYVLGSLAADERSEFEFHLRACSACSHSVSELADIPGLLALVDVDDFGDIDTIRESAKTHGAMAVALKPATRWRRAHHVPSAGITVAACIAAASIVIGGLAFLQSHSLTSPPASPQAQISALPMTAVRPSPLSATVSLAGHSRDTDIEMRCTYGQERDDTADGDDLAMVVVGRDGSHTQLTTWMGHSGVTATPAGVVALPLDQIAAVQIISAHTGDVLLNRMF